MLLLHQSNLAAYRVALHEIALAMDDQTKRTVTGRDLTPDMLLIEDLTQTVIRNIVNVVSEIL